MSRLDSLFNSDQKEIAVTVPKSWSVLASDILAQKYLRQLDEDCYENDIRDVAARLAEAWTYWGSEFGYFDQKEADLFREECVYSLVFQLAAPNSPQWFNTGLFLAYGLSGQALGHWYVDESGRSHLSENTYEHPQAHACFIQSVKSDLVREGGLMDLWAREARLFKLGSGTGTNFSCVPGAGEPLPGGGIASGLMGFLKVGDVSAGAIRSGGVTRRAAKMVILDMDHPDIETFIDWKLQEEHKVASLIYGSELLATKLSQAKTGDTAALEFLPAPLQDEAKGPRQSWRVYDGDFNGEAYASISGQNSNNSVRVSSSFIHCLKHQRAWSLFRRLDGLAVKQIAASQLWNKLCYAAWACADPGVQFSDTINYWHTCAGDGEIVASNPCSEYLFLEDTGCNLASINLLKFFDGKTFDVAAFVHTCELYTTVLDISVAMAQYPSRTIAERSYRYRTLGLGYANLGGLLMAAGIAYDSEAGRSIAAAITSLLTASAYETSCNLAQKLGAFAAYKENKADCLRVIEQHAKLSHGEKIVFQDIEFKPIDRESLPPQFQAILTEANHIWKRVQDKASRYGIRNAQVSAIAPTGTIGLLMDCDTTGIEPEYALIKNKKMVGGQTRTIVNKVFEAGLVSLGLDAKQCEEIKVYVMKHGEVIGAPHLNDDHYKVFQTSLGANSLSPAAHLKMIAACGPFVSGGISKTINLNREATVEDVSKLYLEAYHSGVKSISIYRDGCKLSQPLTSKKGIFLPCPKCGKQAMVPAGTCHKCENCGETTSCS